MCFYYLFCYTCRASSKHVNLLNASTVWSCSYSLFCAYITQFGIKHYKRWMHSHCSLLLNADQIYGMWSFLRRFCFVEFVDTMKTQILISLIAKIRISYEVDGEHTHTQATTKTIPIPMLPSVDRDMIQSRRRRKRITVLVHLIKNFNYSFKWDYVNCNCECVDVLSHRDIVQMVAWSSHADDHNEEGIQMHFDYDNAQRNL